MQVDTLMIDAGADIYYDQGFRNVLEDHMSYLRNHATTHAIAVEPIQAHKYRFDLFGLLSDCNVPPYMHWLVMRMNKMTAPTEANTDLSVLLIPNFTTVDHIRQAYVSTQRIN